MRLINNQKSIEENLSEFNKIIGPYFADLNLDPVNNQKKIIEVCHAGKFLMLLGDGFAIKQLSEKPDFIISTKNELVGLEHQIIIDSKFKEREGFFENIFSIAELELQNDKELPNFLANCYLTNTSSFRLADKEKLIQEIKRVIKHYIKTNELIQNSLILEISLMPHSQISLSPNMGAWWQKGITSEILQSAITKKDRKINAYVRNSVPKQWLLLVIGSLKDSSYEVEKEFHFELNTKYEKVFLLEDFRARLFELK